MSHHMAAKPNSDWTWDLTKSITAMLDKQLLKYNQHIQQQERKGIGA